MFLVLEKLTKYTDNNYNLLPEYLTPWFCKIKKITIEHILTMLSVGCAPRVIPIALFKIYSTRCPWKTWYTMKGIIQETRTRWQSHAQRAQYTRISTFSDSFCAILLLLKCIIYAYGCQYHFLYEPQAAQVCARIDPEPVFTTSVIPVFMGSLTLPFAYLTTTSYRY